MNTVYYDKLFMNNVSTLHVNLGEHLINMSYSATTNVVLRTYCKAARKKMYVMQSLTALINIIYLYRLLYIIKTVIK